MEAGKGKTQESRKLKSPVDYVREPLREDLWGGKTGGPEWRGANEEQGVQRGRQRRVISYS